MSTITVGSSAALTNALKSAQSGDVIALKPGVYSDLAIKYLSFAGAGVTVTSADPNQQAVLTNFGINQVQGLKFANVELSALNPTGTAVGGFAFQILGSKNVTFDQVKVHGSLDNNAGNDTGGLLFQNSTDIKVTNSEFTQLRQAVAGMNGSKLEISDNNAHDLMKTGFVVAGFSDVKIHHNMISDIRAINGEHPDAIQFFTTGTTASARNIEVSNNVILRGGGDFTQGIFFRDQVGTLPFQNVVISNNLVVGTGYGGVYVAGAQGLVIEGNELVSVPGKVNATWMRVELSDNVRVSGNEAIAITYDKVTHLTETGNALNTVVQDGGSAAIRDWSIAHPSDSALLAPHVSLAASLASTFVQDVAPPTAALTAPVGAASVVEMTSKQVELTFTKNYQVEAIGNALDNKITGSAFDNKLVGNGGNDTLDGMGGNDTLIGGTGDDTYIVPNSLATIVEKAGEGTDTVVAKGNFVLGANLENLVVSNAATNGWSGTGNELDNQLTGNAGANRLDGLTGNDTINGGAGNDTIVGGAGNDLLMGGVGADTFVFAVGSGSDVVADFGAGRERDVLDVSNYLRAGYKATLQDVGADVVIRFTSGDSITVLGVHANDLKATAVGWVF